MSKLTFKAIAVRYGAAYISCNGMEVLREAQAKVWNVAVKTHEPFSQYMTHADWQLAMILERGHTSELIGHLERMEALETARRFKGDKGLSSAKVLSNS